MTMKKNCFHYILQLASKMKPDDGEFVYCLPRNRKNKRARYDPFDLQVVSPNESRSERVYWTVSASFITRVSTRSFGTYWHEKVREIVLKAEP